MDERPKKIEWPVTRYCPVCDRLHDTERPLGEPCEAPPAPPVSDGLGGQFGARLLREQRLQNPRAVSDDIGKTAGGDNRVREVLAGVAAGVHLAIDMNDGHRCDTGIRGLFRHSHSIHDIIRDHSP